MRRSVRMLLAGASAALMLGACGEDRDTSDERAAQVRSAALDAGLEADVADFLGLAARGATATYQVTYPGPTPDSRLVVANRPPDRRVDVLVGGVVTEVRLVLDGEAFSCLRDGTTGELDVCERTDAFVDAPGLLDEFALDRLTTSLLERRDDFTFRFETTAVAGVEATCLVTEVRAGRQRPELGEQGTLCVSAEGVLLLVEQAGESLEASDYATLVPDGTFVRPDEAA